LRKPGRPKHFSPLDPRDRDSAVVRLALRHFRPKLERVGRRMLVEAGINVAGPASVQVPMSEVLAMVRDQEFIRQVLVMAGLFPVLRQRNPTRADLDKVSYSAAFDPSYFRPLTREDANKPRRIFVDRSDRDFVREHEKNRKKEIRSKIILAVEQWYGGALTAEEQQLVLKSQEVDFMEISMLLDPKNQTDERRQEIATKVDKARGELLAAAKAMQP
jgi:hypothetical protein